MQTDVPLKRHRLPNLEHGRTGFFPAGRINLDPSGGSHGDIPNEGRVQPQIDATGVCIAADRCIIPVSPACACFASRSRAADSAMDVIPTRLMTAFFDHSDRAEPIGTSALPPINTIRLPLAWARRIMECMSS